MTSRRIATGTILVGPYNRHASTYFARIIENATPIGNAIVNKTHTPAERTVEEMISIFLISRTKAVTGIRRSKIHGSLANDFGTFSVEIGTPWIYHCDETETHHEKRNKERQAC